jgi:hypothetical protein
MLCPGRIRYRVKYFWRFWDFHVIQSGGGCSIYLSECSGKSNYSRFIPWPCATLKVVGTLGKSLEIGFIIEDIVREMAKNNKGRLYIVLYATLLEYYSENIVVAILLEIARLIKVDN